MRLAFVLVAVLAVLFAVEAKIAKIAKLRQTLSAKEQGETAALHILEDERGEWHVYSDLITEKAHEGIAMKAMNAAGASSFDGEGLRTGVIWNDMPSGVETEEAAMIKDGHMDVDTWSRLFFVTGGVDDLVFNVHYGCLQHMHSMAPIQRRQAKANAGSRIVFTNEDVRGFIIGQLKMWWNAAKQTPADKKRYSWYLGHILHAVQDSYPRGHVVRDTTDSSCGNVVLFQGYDAQHGNGAHKKGDYTPSNKNKETDPTLTKRYQCAVDFSTRILNCFKACLASPSACDFDRSVGSWLKTDVYNFATRASTRLAGGSHADFAKSDIAAANSGFRLEAGVSIGGTRTVNLYNPTSTALWSRQQSVRLCDGNGPVLSKAPTTTLGIKHYNEKAFNQYVNYAAPSNTY
jgi:hypothetical protein